MKALAEMRVLSPLRLCGLTKAEIRQRSREAGLFTWEKPAYACLATRIPSGMQITGELLTRVEGAEGALFAMGFTDFRVRVREGGALLQFHRAQMEEACRKNGIEFYHPSPIFCTDNAAMIGVAGYYEYIKGIRDGWDLNAKPNLKIGER